jgi:hypothetical protein
MLNTTRIACEAFGPIFQVAHPPGLSRTRHASCFVPGPAPLSRLGRLLHTFTFRLALVYEALFWLSVMILFGFTRYLEDQTASAVHSRYGVLMDEYRQGGTEDPEERNLDTGTPLDIYTTLPRTAC